LSLLTVAACHVLQEYLTTCCEDQTLLIVSHDRAFLNAVCEETIELKNQQLR
jgi:ATP-binding cassette subfamily F protein 3